MVEYHAVWIAFRKLAPDKGFYLVAESIFPWDYRTDNRRIVASIIIGSIIKIFLIINIVIGGIIVVIINYGVAFGVVANGGIVIIVDKIVIVIAVVSVSIGIVIEIVAYRIVCFVIFGIEK